MTSGGATRRRFGGGALAVVVTLVLLEALVRFLDDGAAPSVASPAPATASPSSATEPSAPSETSPSPTAPSSEPSSEPSGAPTGAPKPRRGVFDGNRTLVAYYGTAGTGSLGVLGEGSPDQVIGRLTKAAQAFARPGRPVQVVYELIVTIADGIPGPGKDYNHDLARTQVESYIKAARRHDALLLLDLQPGRTDFLSVARRWTWALKDRRVGLALDPEWRMHGDEVPGRVIGSVDAAEINEVSLWLANLQRRGGLPQKLFVMHQFRTSMIERMARIAVRQRLATVQHIDGFGTVGQKLATYHAVLRPQKFYPGFKLFYDEDVGLMSPARVLAIRPRVRFVSYQ